MDNHSAPLRSWLSILYRYGRSHISKVLEPYNIGSGQYIFLMVLLKNNGISQEELSDYLKIDKATTAKAVRKLEQAGYVVRDVNSDDKRAYQVFLTERAEAIIPVIQEAIKSWEEMITADLTAEERQLMERLLARMARRAYQGRAKAEEAP